MLYAKWYIPNRKGSVQLEVKDGGKYQSRVLNYEWSEKGKALIKVIENI